VKAPVKSPATDQKSGSATVLAIAYAKVLAMGRLRGLKMVLAMVPARVPVMEKSARALCDGSCDGSQRII